MRPPRVPRRVLSFLVPLIVALTLAITTINAWNRIAVGFRAPVGTYQPQQITRKFSTF